MRIFLALMLLAGCSTGKPTPAPPPVAPYPVVVESEKAVTMALAECTQKAIPRLDDGTSSADVIGRAVAFACSSEGERLFAAMSVRLTSGDTAALRSRWKAMLANDATEQVLKRRVNARE